MKRALGIAFGIVLATVCLWLFFRGVENPDRLWAQIRSASLPLLAVLVISNVLHLLLRALRWRTLLGEAGRRVPFLELYSAVSIGYMASLLPARIGEVLRPTLLSRRTGVPLGTALATVGAERAVLDSPLLLLMLGLSLVLPSSLTGIGVHSDPTALARMRAFGLVALAGSAAGLVVVVLLGRHRAAVDLWLRGWAERRGGRVARFVQHSIGSLLPGLATFGRLGGVVRLTFESILIWGVISVGIHVGIVACGVELAPLATLIVLPVTAFSFLAMTPGGAGAYQLAMFVVLVNLFGADGDRARVAGLVVHAISLVPVLAVGGWFAVRSGLARPAGPGPAAAGNGSTPAPALHAHTGAE